MFFFFFKGPCFCCSLDLTLSYVVVPEAQLAHVFSSKKLQKEKKTSFLAFVKNQHNYYQI